MGGKGTTVYKSSEMIQGFGEGGNCCHSWDMFCNVHQSLVKFWMKFITGRRHQPKETSATAREHFW